MLLLPMDEAMTTVLLRNLHRRGYVEIASEGYSMYPFIRPGDVCKFIPCDVTKLVAGDVVLYVSQSGRLVGHRLLHVIGIPLNMGIVLQGDTNVHSDGLISTDAVLGRLIEIRRGRRVIVTHLGIARVWTLLILKVPLMSKSVRKWLHITLIWQHRWNRLRLSSRFSSREHS